MFSEFLGYLLNTYAITHSEKIRDLFSEKHWFTDITRMFREFQKKQTQVCYSSNTQNTIFQKKYDLFWKMLSLLNRRHVAHEKFFARKSNGTLNA